MTPEQIIQKLAERIEDTLFNDEWLGTNEVGCVELLETLKAELQPLADLIRAAQQLYAETADYVRINNLGDVHHNQSMKDMQAALDKLAGEQK